MADAFISYKKEDREHAQRMVDALRGEGLSVFWDPETPIGSTFDEELKEQLKVAGSIVVLWTCRSVDSPWVREEARQGVDRGVLVPVLLDKAKAPLGFGLLESAELQDWDGDRQHPEFRLLVASIKENLLARETQPSPPPAVLGTAALARLPLRWRLVTPGKIGVSLVILLLVLAAMQWPSQAPGGEARAFEPLPLIGAFRGSRVGVTIKSLGKPTAEGRKFDNVHVSFMENGHIIWLYPDWEFLVLNSNSFTWSERRDAHHPNDTNDQCRLDDEYDADHSDRRPGKHVPIGGARRLWNEYRASVGWETGNCMFEDTIWGQPFENGRVIGPLPAVRGGAVAVAVVIVDDKWQHVALSEDIALPECGALYECGTP